MPSYSLAVVVKGYGGFDIRGPASSVREGADVSLVLG